MSLFSFDLQYALSAFIAGFLSATACVIAVLVIIVLVKLIKLIDKIYNKQN
ncbi:MAG: hypothetical protein FWE82_09425 [Defluviitaleaceae bacterium]|nr:hypothetical protein [Defluviitaleaceae bacterium]